jgi:two-component system, chemotaxis family, protein-glutamate methylesterase/glutaminase
MINLLLVDDSGFMRLILADMLEADAQIKVVATAENGKEAFDKVQSCQPDVVLLDLVMKDYDGLYAVREIMAHCPTPIVILSSLGNTHFNSVFEALEAGAYDFLNKPNSEHSARIRDLQPQLAAKIKQAAAVDRNRLVHRKATVNHHPHTFDSQLSFDILVIGASTGGTGAIEEILNKLPGNFPIPVVIAQHMPAGFIPLFARRLDQMLPLNVKVAEPGERLNRGTVYIAPGEYNTLIKAEGPARSGAINGRIARTEQHFAEFNHPSVDCLMESIAEVYGSRALAVILTGMGKDGARSMELLHRQKALTLAQDESTSVVFGMPRAAIERNAVRHVLPIQEIPGFIVSCLS